MSLCNSSLQQANDIVKAESLRSSLKELEGLLEKYSPMMDAQTERAVDKVIKYGTIFAEVSSPIRVPP